MYMISKISHSPPMSDCVWYPRDIIKRICLPFSMRGCGSLRSLSSRFVRSLATFPQHDFQPAAAMSASSCLNYFVTFPIESKDAFSEKACSTQRKTSSVSPPCVAMVRNVVARHRRHP
jgi:hypothetical protein